MIAPGTGTIGSPLPRPPSHKLNEIIAEVLHPGAKVRRIARQGSSRMSGQGFCDQIPVGSRALNETAQRGLI